MTRPRILISTASRYRTEGLWRMDSIGGMNYAEAVVQTGGLPLFAPNVMPELAPELLAQADGLLLSGGADVDPKHFGQAPHPDLGMVEESRDLLELALYRAAKEKGLPVLGICRGIQVINIAEGGTLHQHLPALPGTVQHSQRNKDGTPFHAVRLEPATRLAEAHGASDIRTNSYHHQAIDQLAPNLKATGWAGDGIIEAVEGTGDTFVLGVQWHPEMSFAKHPEHLAPFRAFMKAFVEGKQPEAVPV